MDLNYTPEEIAFRDEVRAFLSEKLPKEMSDKVKYRKHLTKEDMQGWLAHNGMQFEMRVWLLQHAQ